MYDCPVCGAPAELVRPPWMERHPQSTTLVERVQLRCVAYHWVVMDLEELRARA